MNKTLVQTLTLSMQSLDLKKLITDKNYKDFPQSIDKVNKQAGAELCQAQAQLGSA